MRFFLFVATMAIAGCGDSGPTVSESAKVEMQGANRLPYASLLEARRSSGQETLRVRVDTARNRLWVLGLNHVDVYGIAENQLIQRIELPGSFVAELVCLPDMALDRSGTAFISHNLKPMLWQIDADSFQLKEHVIRLLNREHWDIGFGGLAFAPDGALFGVTASGGSLWSIDIGNASAHQVELNALIPDACGPSVAPVGVEDRADGAFSTAIGKTSHGKKERSK